MTDGLVRVVFTETDGARLAGWVQSSAIHVPRGTRLRVDSVSEIDSRAIHGDDAAVFSDGPSLVVRVSASDAGGPFEPWTFIFFERPRTDDLRTLDGLASFFQRTLSEPLPVHFDAETRWGGEWPELEPISWQVIFDQLMALRGYLAERGDVDGRFARMLDNAYALGRAVRQEEIASRHAATVVKAENARAGHAAGAEVTNKARQAQLVARRGKVKAFAELKLTRQAGPGGKAWDYSNLASEVLEAWEDEADKPKHSTVVADLRALNLPPRVAG